MCVSYESRTELTLLTMGIASTIYLRPVVKIISHPRDSVDCALLTGRRKKLRKEHFALQVAVCRHSSSCVFSFEWQILFCHHFHIFDATKKCIHPWQPFDMGIVSNYVTQSGRPQLNCAGKSMKRKPQPELQGHGRCRAMPPRSRVMSRMPRRARRKGGIKAVNIHKDDRKLGRSWVSRLLLWQGATKMTHSCFVFVFETRCFVRCRFSRGSRKSKFEENR